MVYMKYYIHYVPGRMRIESPVLHDPVKAKEFETFMKGLNGIAAIEVHPATGSAIMHFDEIKSIARSLSGFSRRTAISV